MTQGSRPVCVLPSAPSSLGAASGANSSHVLDAASLSVLQPFLDSMPFLAMLVDARRRIVLVNGATTAAVGTSAPSLVGAHCADVCHGCEEPVAGCPLETVRAEGGAHEVVRHESATGRWLAVGVMRTSYCTADGVAVFLHWVRDISAEKRVSLELERKARTHAALSRLLHLSMSDQSLDSLLQRVLDEILDIPWLSLGKQGAIFLLEDDQSLTLRVQRSMSSEVRRACARVVSGWCLCGRAARTGEVQHAAEVGPQHEFHYAGQAAHGHYCVPIRADGRVCGVLTLYLRPGHAEDAEEIEFLQAVGDGLGGIVQRKLAELSLSASRERLIQAEGLATIGTLAAGVAHEIKNPLAFVICNLDYVQHELQELLAVPSGGEGSSGDASVRRQLEEMRLAVGDAQSGGERIRTIVRDMHTFARTGRDSSALLDLNEVLESAINIAGVQIGPRAQLIKSFGRLPPVKGNDGRLGQVFLNLLVNAAQALSEHDAAGHVISVRTYSEGDEVIAEIQDNGSGMAPATLERLFEPFFTTKGTERGTGLGLWISRNIVVAHGGRISAESELHQGSTFTVRLPQAR